MADEFGHGGGVGPTTPLPPGPLLTIGDGALWVDVAPTAGGRIAQIRVDGIEQLVGHGDYEATAAIAWGSYPMLPWCGRLRDGRFIFVGEQHCLPANLGAHAIHGLGFLLPWQVQAASAREVELALQLPEDARWPFGGSARQHLAVDGRRLRMTLSVTAGARAMPVARGWHPWFRKPDRLEFSPEAMYPRDAAGIAVRPVVEVGPGPWDDCFINRHEVVLERNGQRLRIGSACIDWVVYDGTAHATCVEPQTAPPDSFNLSPRARLAPGETMHAECVFAWD